MGKAQQIECPGPVAAAPSGRPAVWPLEFEGGTSRETYASPLTIRTRASGNAVSARPDLCGDSFRQRWSDPCPSTPRASADDEPDFLLFSEEVGLGYANGSEPRPDPTVALIAAQSAHLSVLLPRPRELVVGQVHRYHGHDGRRIAHAEHQRVEAIGDPCRVVCRQRIVGAAALADGTRRLSREPIQPCAVQAQDEPLVPRGDLRIMPPLTDLFGDLEPPQRFDLPLRS